VPLASSTVASTAEEIPDDADDLAGGDGVDQAVIGDALITVQTHRDGGAFRYEHAIDRAYVLLMSLHQLGILVDDPLGGER